MQKVGIEYKKIEIKQTYTGNYGSTGFEVDIYGSLSPNKSKM